MNVIKRDGSKQNFDQSKIKVAITKANNSVKEDLRIKESTINVIVSAIVKKCNDLGTDVPIEAIQDMVEDELIDRRAKAVAKAYVVYRYEHQLIRDKYSDLMKKVSIKIFAKDVKNQNANVDERSFGGRKGEACDVLMREVALNSLMSQLAKDRHLNNEIYTHDLNAWATGEPNCLSIPYDHLLRDGFVLRQTDIRGAKSINTAFQLIAVIAQLQSLSQFGGVSATHTDVTLIPYVRFSFMKHFVFNYIKDTSDFFVTDIAKMNGEELDNWVKEHKALYLNELGLTEDDFYFDSPIKEKYPKYYQQALFDTLIETKQAVEGLYHNLNSLQSRSGGQLPFTSINYGLSTTPEGRMLTRTILEVLIEGLGKHHRTSVFPCGIFQLKKGVNLYKGDPNYDLFRLALKATALRLYPNYCNCDWSVQQNCVKMDRSLKNRVLSELESDDFSKLKQRLRTNKRLCYLLGLEIVDDRLQVKMEESPLEANGTMGCRTWNGFDVNFEVDYRENIAKVIAGEDLPDWTQTSGIQKDGRGNVCPVTIILPTIAMEAGRDVEKFMKLLDQMIHDARDILLERFEYMCKQSPASAKFVYENHLYVGYKPEEGVRSALKHGTLVIGKLGLAECLTLLIGKDHTTEEGMTLAKRIEQLYKDRCNEFKKEYHLNFGVYETPAENLSYTALVKFRDKYGIIPGVSDKEYFTNSMHVPVTYHCNPFEKADIECQLAPYSSAGHIFYAELEGSCKHNIDALEEFIVYTMEHDLPYVAINVPNDQCMDCGYLNEFNDRCPECGSENIMQLRRVTGYTTSNYKTAFNPGKVAETENRVKHK